MNRQRRARSPPPFGGGFDPRMVGRVDPRLPPDYNDLYPHHAAPFEPLPGGPPPAFMEPPPPHPGPQPYPPGFRDNRLPSTYRATLREPQPFQPTVGQPAPYKILCITNLNPKVADGPLRDALKEDFSPYGEISVTICHDNGERLAYIYFRSYEEAREARHTKSKTILFDKPIEIEPIYEPRSSPIGTPPPPTPHMAPHPAQPVYPPRRRSITPPDYYGADDPAQPPAMDFSRRAMPPMPYHRGAGGVSPPPGYPAPMPHHYPNHRQSPPGPMPYGRYYMGQQPPDGAQSPYSSPPHEPYGRSYHPSMQFPPGQPPYPGPYGPPHGREPRERLINDGQMIRGQRYDSYYPVEPRDYPMQAHYQPSRSPPPQPPPAPMQPGSSHHHYAPIPPELHGPQPGYGPMRHASPPRYIEHPRYTSREFRREKLGGEHGDPDDGKPSRVLFITNIDPSKTESELRNIFDPYGTIEEVEIRKISSDIASAIIKFSSMDCAYKAKTALNGKYLGKVKCRILYGKVSASRRLWIGGFGPNTTMVRLEDEFGRYGEIVNLDYISGRPYAYIEYESANQAQFATQHLRGTFVADAERRIRIEYVDPVKNDKTAKQQATSGGRQSPENDSRSRGAAAANESSWTASARDLSPQPRSIKRRSITPPDGSTKRIPQIPDGSPKSSTFSDERKSKITSSLAFTDESSNLLNELATSHRAKPASAGHEPVGGSLQSRLAQSKSIREVVDCCSVSWFGKLVLRNFTFPSKMFLFSGHEAVIEKYITKLDGDNGDQCPILPITQRWRLHSQPKLEEVKRRMQSGNLAMVIITSKPDQHSPSTSISSPASKTPMSSSSYATATTPSKQNGDRADESCSADGKGDISTGGESSPPAQSRPLKNLISYLEQKDAAGVISLSAIDRDHQIVDGKDTKTLYAFPPGDFALNLLKQRAPNLRLESTREEFLLGVIVGVSETKI